MKIGLLTFHSALNYGAVLQATALYKTLESISSDTELINFRFPPVCSIVDHTRRNELKDIRNLLRFIVKGRMICKKKRNFDLFLSNHITKISKETNEYNELEKECREINYDICVCGSDQIWNPYITHFESAYFLKFLGQSTKKISYAASIGQEIIGDDGIKYISDNIDAIDTISVREESAVDILRKAGVTKSISVNFDPVFFLSAEEWKEKQIFVNLSSQFNKFILVYRLTDNHLMDKVLEELTETTGLPCIAITERLGKIPYVSKKLSSIGPGEFIYLINNAEYIVTDSFHGIAFSLIFEKKLIAVSNLQRNTRIINLLSKTGMSECLVDQNEKEHYIPQIDYKKKYDLCMNIIDKEKKKNLAYLYEEIRK